MAYSVQLELFQGPLDLLLKLIEEQELDITEIALAEITDSFIKHLDQVEERFPEELADFLVIATRLIYIKSRALLPWLEREEEEETGEQLAAHLKMYKAFRDASVQLEERIASKHYGVPRPVLAKQFDRVEFAPPASVTMERLASAYRTAIGRMQNVIRIPKAAIRKAITVKERIVALSKVLEQHKQISFKELVEGEHDRTEIVVTFLAILELVKSQTVTVHQPASYSDFVITQN